MSRVAQPARTMVASERSFARISASASIASPTGPSDSGFAAFLPFDVGAGGSFGAVRTVGPITSSAPCPSPSSVSASRDARSIIVTSRINWSEFSVPIRRRTAGELNASRALRARAPSVARSRPLSPNAPGRTRVRISTRPVRTPSRRRRVPSTSLVRHCSSVRPAVDPKSAIVRDRLDASMRRRRSSNPPSRSALHSRSPSSTLSTPITRSAVARSASWVHRIAPCPVGHGHSSERTAFPPGRPNSRVSPSQ